jgi:hypothetical protein
MELLINGIGYVSLRFSDGSCKTIRASLNKGILSSYGVESRQGYFYDIDKQQFVEFRPDADTVEVYDHFPIYENEVVKFASRFI